MFIFSVLKSVFTRIYFTYNVQRALLFKTSHSHNSITCVYFPHLECFRTYFCVPTHSSQHIYEYDRRVENKKKK